MIPFWLMALAMTLASTVPWLLPLLRPTHVPGDELPPGSPHRHTVLGLTLAVALWAGTVGLYLLVGNPGVLRAGQADPAQAAALAVPSLQERLQRTPDDTGLWRQLAQAHQQLGQHAQAVRALQQALQRQTPDADLYTEYAVALGLAQSHSLAGAPEAALHAALALNPRHVQALALSLEAAREQQDWAGVQHYGGQLLAVLPPESDLRAQVVRDVQQAQAVDAPR